MTEPRDRRRRKDDQPPPTDQRQPMADAPAHDDEPGQEDEPRRILGRYRLEERIAVGGMAEVWRARDEVLGRQVAVKLLHTHLLPEAASRARFEAEARSAAGLSHPGIVGVYDVAVSDDEAAIVLEYVPGEALNHILARRGRLPQREAVDLAAQVGEALEHAHSRGVVHRDVKPDNILVAADGRARLLDFGIARTVEESRARLTSVGTVVGTLRYMAPEQLAGEAGDVRTDVFGLGSTLYQMLAGRPPYDADAPVQLLEQQRQPPATIAGVPSDLMGIVMGALETDPRRRHASAGDLAWRLRAWLTQSAAREAADRPSGGSGTQTSVVPAVRAGEIAGREVREVREVPAARAAPAAEPRPRRDPRPPARPAPRRDYWVERRPSRARPLMMAVIVLALLAGGILVVTELAGAGGFGRPGGQIPANAETRTFEAVADARVALADGSEVGAGANETLPIGEWEGFLYRSLVRFEPDWQGMERIARIELRLTSTTSVNVRRNGSATTLVRRNTGDWEEGSAEQPSGRNAVTWGNKPETTDAGGVSFEGPAGSNEEITVDVTALYLAMAPHTLDGGGEADLGLTLLAASDDGNGASGGDTNEFWSSEAGGRGPELIVTYVPR